jgi:cytidine deaminase
MRSRLIPSLKWARHLLTRAGEVVTGANVESVGYGLMCCANLPIEKNSWKSNVHADAS